MIPNFLSDPRYIVYTWWEEGDGFLRYFNLTPFLRSFNSNGFSGLNTQNPRPGPRPQPHPSPTTQASNNQQRQFDDCARAAWRAFRKGYLWESGRGAIGGLLVAGGIYIAIRGIPGAAPIGIVAAISAGTAGNWHGIEGPIKAGGYAAASVGLLGAYMINRSVQEQTKNIGARDAALGDCQKSFPNANHSMSFLNF